ncbi:adenylate cyclase [Rhizobium sp. SG_E_25_P2]|nr:adenylate cyclase [Rhizobium sp. SG_E_25_P2]
MKPNVALGINIPSATRLPGDRCMPKEIERKFLIDSDEWRKNADGGKKMRQAIILSEPDRSVRVRLIDGKRARLTVKIDCDTFSRHEFEYEIPMSDAREMLQLANGSAIVKTRYEVPFKGFVWEVDVYEGAFAGLIVAEVEMKSEKDKPPLPPWVGIEVSDDRRFSNRAIAEGSLGKDWKQLVQDKLERSAAV